MNIIPRPAHLELREGTWHISSGISIHAPEPLASVIADLSDSLPRMSESRFSVSRVPSPVEANVVLQLAERGPDSPIDGSHTLRIRADGITVSGANVAGVFYGAQSLKQLLATAGPELPCCDVIDQPRFPWRGMHLDVGRHFFDTAFVKRYLNLMAIHKFNVLHWHLTDDQGWRIEVDGYPELVDVGAWRDEPMGTYGGFFTRDEAREIVAYAAQRHISVVPEIALPGHARAALAAYPPLGCRGDRMPVPCDGGIFADLFCAGNNQVFQFLYDVLGEVMELFPGRYFHIGGDVCPKIRWKECPKCQARIQSESLRDEKQLHSWFISEICRFLRSAGKSLVGWEGILEGGLAPGATVMSRHGMAAGIAAAQQGHDVIMTPSSHCAFDARQAAAETEPGARAVNPLQNVYALEPIPAQLPPEQHKHILGGQGNVWTERMPTADRVEFMVLPRMIALAESIWSPRHLRDWRDYCKRLRVWMPRIGALGYTSRQLDNELSD